MATKTKKRVTKKSIMKELKESGYKLPHGYEVKRRVKKKAKE